MEGVREGESLSWQPFPKVMPSNPDREKGCERAEGKQEAK